MKRIVVATDGSPSSAAAVAFGVDLAAEHHSDLAFVHVVPALDVVPSAGIGGFGCGFPHEPCKHDHEVLADACAIAAEHGVTATRALLRGDTVREVVAYADSHDADLIVVGSRGHRAIATALLGSVSRGVLKETKRQVLVVRPESVPAPVGAAV
jgi:nucleotide-binding universal stress UspA family protein